MSEQKLSQEQIEAAQKMLNAGEWSISAIAPHLQYPIAEPTKAEGERLIKIYDSYPASLVESAMAGLRDFIANRNTAMQPKPDPRIDVLRSFGIGDNARPILAALDALKDAK